MQSGCVLLNNPLRLFFNLTSLCRCIHIKLTEQQKDLRGFLFFFFSILFFFYCRCSYFPPAPEHNMALWNQKWQIWSHPIALKVLPTPVCFIHSRVTISAYCYCVLQWETNFTVECLNYLPPPAYCIVISGKGLWYKENMDPHYKRFKNTFAPVSVQQYMAVHIFIWVENLFLLISFNDKMGSTLWGTHEVITSTLI